MTKSNTEISTFDRQTLNEGMIRSYIIESVQNGCCRDAQFLTKENRFVLTTNNYNEIWINENSAGGSIWWIYTVNDKGDQVDGQTVESLRELNKVVRQAAKSYGDFWGDEPSIARLNKGHYAGNVARLASLIGNREIEAIFDPYLCNASLLTVTDLISIGGFSLSQDVRMLSLEKMARGTTPELTKTFVDGWLRERGLPGGEVKMTRDAHERFLLLSGGTALVIGCSLNRITHDETAHTAPDNDYRSTFEKRWTAATDLP